MHHPLRAAARRFLVSEEASLSVEAVLIMPALVFAYVAGFQFFDGYRQEAQLYKATYAVADLVSRQEVVSPADLIGLEGVFATLTGSGDASYLRYSELRRADRGIAVVWSYATDDQAALDDRGLQAILASIPRLDPNERLLLIESYVYDAPFFDLGIDARILHNVVPVSARYESCVVFLPNPAAENPGCVSPGEGGAGGGVGPGAEMQDDGPIVEG